MIGTSITTRASSARRATVRKRQARLGMLTTRTTARTAIARYDARERVRTIATTIRLRRPAAIHRSLGCDGKTVNAMANANGGSRYMATALGVVLRNAGAPLRSSWW